MGDFSYSMAEFTKFSFLRGPSEKSDVSFAETNVTDEGVYKTSAGEYIPAETTYKNDVKTVTHSAQANCPDGTFASGDNNCGFLRRGSSSYAGGPTLSVSAYVSEATVRKPVSCPAGTYLTPDNICAFSKVEKLNFALKPASASGNTLAGNRSLYQSTDCPDVSSSNAIISCVHMGADGLSNAPVLVQHIY
ncbi:hypothetical protein N9M10_03100 [Hellea sp.]|nr:hypothetical protein [Hellea sp.]